MARTESVRTWWHELNRDPIGRLFNDHKVPRTRWRAGICPAILLLYWTAACAAGSGPGIAIKAGAQTVQDPIGLDKTTRARLELELSTAKFADDHLDIAFIFGGSSLGSISDEDAYWDDDVFVEEFYNDDLAVVDVRLAARLYPLGGRAGIQPYLGAGIGYFWFLDRYKDEYSETWEDPLSPGDWYTSTASEEDTETLARGFFPFVMAGLTVPIGNNSELMFEFQYDIEKTDSGFDLGGPIYMFGARFRF